MNSISIKVFTLIFSALVLISLPASGQSKTLLKLKEDKKVSLKLYFYPSTLRMINLNNNEEINELIKDLKKIIFFRMKSDFQQEQFKETYQTLKSKESFDEYLIIEDKEAKVYVLGKESPANTVVIAKMEDEYYIGEVIGSLDVSKIPNLVEQLSSEDSELRSDFIDLSDIFGQGRKKKSRKEEIIVEPKDSVEQTIKP